MADVHSPERRCKNMRAIRDRGTRPELMLRELLFARGFRFLLHVGSLPGKPDVVLSTYRVVIFVHGCFWHGHDCYLFKLPQTRSEFWRNKIGQNQLRDRRDSELLRLSGWRVLIVWECALKGRLSWDTEQLGDCLERWIRLESNLTHSTEIRHVTEADVVSMCKTL